MAQKRFKHSSTLKCDAMMLKTSRFPKTNKALMKGRVFSSKGDFDHESGSIRQTAVLSHASPHDWFLLLIKVEHVTFEKATSTYGIMEQARRGHYGRTSCGPPCLAYQGMYDEHPLFLSKEQEEYVYPQEHYSEYNKDPRIGDFSLRKAKSAVCTVLEHSPKLTQMDFPEGEWSIGEGRKLVRIEIPYENLFFFRNQPQKGKAFDPVPSRVGWHVPCTDDGFYGTIVGMNDADISENECWIMRIDCVLENGYVDDQERRSRQVQVKDYYAHVPVSSRLRWTPPDATWPKEPIYIRTYLNFQRVVCVPPSSLFVPTLREFQASFLLACHEQMPFLETLVRGKIVKVGPIDKEDTTYRPWTWIHVFVAGIRYHVKMKMLVQNAFIESRSATIPKEGDIVFADVTTGRGPGSFRDGKPRLPDAEVIVCRDMEPGFEEFCRFLNNKGYNNSPKWPLGKSRLHDLMLYYWDPTNKENKNGSYFRRKFMKI